MNKRKADFGIINFWWCNDHGAILTAFALQSFLKEEGYSSELLKTGISFDDETRKGGISEQFEMKYLKSSEKKYISYEDIFELENNNQLNNDYVGFITGSDQVFRPEYVPDSWYLTFVNNKGKIAVSASFGTDEFICSDSNRMERISISLKNFDYISVREESGVDICKKIFDVNAFHLLDPVFLINKCEYDNIAFKSNIVKENDFIFCYIRDLSENIINTVNRIKDNYKCEVKWCNEDMPMEDFLFNIINCKYVVTDSYHGLCFSVIFNKNFICAKNISRGKARFDSLQKQLSIPNKNFFDENEETNEIPKINYSIVNNNLKELSGEGAAWLKNALMKTYKKYG